MNHPIVKLYDKHRGDQSIMTTTDSNQAIKNAYKEYYNLAGQKVIPNSTGIYVASDGYIRKLIYLTK